MLEASKTPHYRSDIPIFVLINPYDRFIDTLLNFIAFCFQKQRDTPNTECAAGGLSKRRNREIILMRDSRTSPSERTDGPDHILLPNEFVTFDHSIPSLHMMTMLKMMMTMGRWGEWERYRDLIQSQNSTITSSICF